MEIETVIYKEVNTALSLRYQNVPCQVTMRRKTSLRRNNYKNVSYNNELLMLTFDDCGIGKGSSYPIR